MQSLLFSRRIAPEFCRWRMANGEWRIGTDPPFAIRHFAIRNFRGADRVTPYAGGGTGFRLDRALQTCSPDERSEIRGRWSGSEAAPGFRYAQPGLLTTTNKNKREAERRQAHFVQTSAPYGRGSRETSRARLTAFHHGACGSEPTPPLSSRRASCDSAKKRALPASACPSPASYSQTGHHAGRAFSRSRPGAMVTSRRPREPLSLHQPVPPADVL